MLRGPGPGGVAPRCAIALALLGSGLATLAVAPAAVAIPMDAAAFPQNHIKHYSSGVDCAGWRKPFWTSWNTYAAATIGDRWTATASGKGLCRVARATGISVVKNVVFKDGTGFKRWMIEDWALIVGDGAVTLSGKAGVPGGWRCKALPSVWSLSAFRAAREGGRKEPRDADFAPAQGLAASFGYCTRKRRGALKWIAWGPSLADCYSVFSLKGHPDPDDPDSTIYPSYSETRLWADYDEIPTC